MTGDPTFDPASASWSLVGGALPAGLSLDSATGIVSGTPTAKTNADFSVAASYKGESGSGHYTLTVDSVELKAKSLAIGNSHACAVTLEGGVVCWGFNEYGQLGNNSNDSSSVPVNVVGLTSGVDSVYAASDISCALTAVGDLLCWGFDGEMSWVDSTIPVLMKHEIASVTDLGSYHMGLITKDGKVSRGYQDSGYQALDAYAEETKRSFVSASTVDYGVSCAVDNNGQVVCVHPNNSSYHVLTGVSDVKQTNGGCVITNSSALKCFSVFWQGGVVAMGPVTEVLSSGVHSFTNTPQHDLVITENEEILQIYYEGGTPSVRSLSDAGGLKVYSSF